MYCRTIDYIGSYKIKSWGNSWSCCSGLSNHDQGEDGFIVLSGGRDSAFPWKAMRGQYPLQKGSHFVVCCLSQELYCGQSNLEEEDHY